MTELKRNEIVELGYELAKEIAPGDNRTQVFMEQILQEFTRRLADKIQKKQEFKSEPETADYYHEVNSGRRCNSCGKSWG